MENHPSLVTVFGGTGFLGRLIIAKLTQKGFRVRAAVRYPEKGRDLKMLGEVGQIELIQASLLNPQSLEQAIVGAENVINCVGILFEKNTQKFSPLHASGPQNIASLAARHRLKSMIHVSALGADAQSTAHYLRTKAQGEEAALKAFPATTIVRPSVLFGFEDHFINRFATMMAQFRIAPLIGGGRTRLQPVYVGDVACAIVQLLNTSPSLRKRPPIFELAGPDILSFREIEEKIAATLHIKPFFLSLPFPIARSMAFFLQHISGNLLTVDQVKMLQKDNVLTHQHPGFEALNLTPCTLDSWLPALLSYLFSPKRNHPFSTLS